MKAFPPTIQQQNTNVSALFYGLSSIVNIRYSTQLFRVDENSIITMEHSSPNETGAQVPGDTTQSQPPPSESQQGTNHLGGIKVSLVPAHKTAFMRRLSKERRVCRFILSDPWFQIYIISVICQNLPGVSQLFCREPERLADRVF